MYTADQLSAKTLGQIALIQGMVSHLPDRKTILQFVRRGLEIVPGVERVRYRLYDRAVEQNGRADQVPEPGVFQLKFGGHLYGEMLFNITDEALFTPYIPYIENLSMMLGVIFEERHQRRLNEKHKTELERRVFERTRQLEIEVRERRRSEKLLDSIINNTSNVIYVKDPDGRFTLVNNRLCEILQMNRSRILGRTSVVLLPAHIGKQHQDNDRRVLSEQRSLTFREHAELADGLHEYISIKFPLLGENAEVVGVCSISTDITDLKAVENALRLDEARLEALLNLFQMTDASMTDITDFALEEAIKLTKSEIGYLAFANEDESVLTMYSWSQEAMKMCAIQDKQFVFPVVETGLWGEAVRQRKPVVTNDYQALKDNAKKGVPEGHVPLVRHMNVPVFEGERIVAVAGVGNKAQDYDEADVRQMRLLMQGMWRLVQRTRANEERAELERRLRQAYKMESIGTLAGGIAHDFNNILAAIFGYTELSLKEVEPGSFVHGSLRSVMEAAKRARDLVGHILAFSRQSEQETMPVDMLPVVREVAKFMRASLPASIEIRQEIRDTPTVMADPTQIHQVIMNLCTNAGQAMDGNEGVLEIRLETVSLDTAFVQMHPGLSPGAHVKLTVSDTGRGMAPDLLDRIFDPFFTTKERGQGTGLGLSVVHGIVKNHGGAIDVYSKVGAGTAFNVFLPAIERRAVTATRTEQVLRGGNEHILFVDDEEPLVRLGVTMLGSLGYTVTGVTSSSDALEQFEAAPEQFDLVITDLTMPKITGDKLAQKLMAIRADIPIILCTGFSSSINEQAAKEMGIQAFINKPILTHQISKIIRSLLDSRQA